MSKTMPNVKVAAATLSGAQMSMLSAAARRDDRCLAPLPILRGAKVAKAGEKLILAGLAREVKARGSCPIWRREGETAFALKLTAAGLNAAVVVGEGASFEETAVEQPPAEVAAASAPTLGAENFAAAAQEPAAPLSAERPQRSEPRPTSKIAAVIGLLSRPGGATISDLIAATGWLPHTTRAALTGLRKRGYVLALDRSDSGRGSLYRIASKPADQVDTAAERATRAS